MNTASILFPHLGIALSHVGRYISVGGFEIAYYGIAVALGMYLGVTLILKLAKVSGQNEDMYLELCMLVLFLSVLGARAYYCIFQWEEYQSDPIRIFYFREGGLAIYGGILTGIAVIVVYCKKKNLLVWKALDTIVPGLVVGQILGRWGNFFNREAFGQYTDSLFAMALPKAAVYQSDITDLMREHIFSVEGVEFIQVHPTFFYESMWNVGILILLLIFWRKRRLDGQVFLLYMICYGVGRFFIERLRTDQLLLAGTQIPVSMLVSAGMVFAGILFWKLRKQDIV